MKSLFFITHFILYYFLIERAEQNFLKNINLFWIILPLLFLILDTILLGKAFYQKNFLSSLSLLFLLVLIPTSILLGQFSFRNAINDCIENTELVRQSILSYYKSTGHYPELGKGPSDFTFQVCGHRFFNGSLLHYEKTEAGFKIFFTDGLIHYEATESEPLFERK